MCESLPYGGFKWLSDYEINTFELPTITDDDEKGYILEVDLEYPDELHLTHADLPFAIRSSIPEYISSKQKKLIASVNNKEKYIIHYKNLAQCLEHGLKLTKIHKVLEFKSSKFLEKYINLNNDMRTKSENDFDKDFFKLMNNSYFGKTIEDVEKRNNVRLLTRWDQDRNRFGASHYINKPNFHSSSVFEENLVAIQMNRVEIFYDKPIYIGFCVLELSKMIMYNFHYNFMKKKNMGKK